MKDNRSWLLGIHNYFTRRWILSAILITIPAFGFTLVDLFGRNWGWITEDGKLIVPVQITLYVLFGASLFFTFVKSYADNNSERAKRDGQFVLDKMLQGVNTIKYKKVQRFVEYIENNHNTKSALPFFEITQPKKQIAVIFDVTQEMLSEIFGISRNNIGMSIVCKIEKDQDWESFYALNTEDDLSLVELLKNSNSAIRKIIDGDRSLIFHPDKRKGIEKQEYISGRIDKTNGNIGSIICKDISLVTNHKYIHSILSISTYGTQLCEENDMDAISKIERILLPAIERRLQLELALHYIREVIARPQNTKRIYQRRGRTSHN